MPGPPDDKVTATYADAVKDGIASAEKLNEAVMNMLELIELIDRMKDRAMIYRVQCGRLFDFMFVEGNDYIVSPSNHLRQLEFRTFTDSEEIIPFLFEREVFGWQVKEWNIEERWTSVSTMDIQLFRVEEQQ